MRHIARSSASRDQDEVITLAQKMCVRLTDMIDYTDKGSGGEIYSGEAMVQVGLKH